VSPHIGDDSYFTRQRISACFDLFISLTISFDDRSERESPLGNFEGPGSQHFSTFSIIARLSSRDLRDTRYSIIIIAPAMLSAGI